MKISLSKGMKYTKYFSLILHDDNTVWGMGSNFFGQLGLKGFAPVARQTRITDLDPSDGVYVTDVKAGNLHSVALKSDGTLWGFGLNMTGALGSLKKGPVLMPEQIPGITGIIAIDAAGDTTYALSEEGILTVLSNNTVKIIENVVHVYAGSNHCFVKMKDGTYNVFGDNTYGVFGNGTTQSSVEPIEVPFLNNANVISISPGNSHTVVLCEGGRLLCCGDNANGQLGIADRQPLNKFVEFIVPDIVSIATGGYHTLLLNSKGEAFAFGFNFFGQLGDGTALQRLAPVKIFDNVEAIAAGTFHSLVASNTGEIHGFGSNDFGQLGDGTFSQKTAPFAVKVSNINVHSVAGGLYNTAILATDGTLYMNGCNLYGQLGISTIDKGTHVPQKILEGVREMECGGTHTVAIVGDNTLYAWGNNSCGQSGNNSTDVNEDGKLGGGDIRNLPAATKIEHGLSFIKACACGENHTLLLDGDGVVYAAGLNNVGQLGDGSTHNKNTFQKIEALPSIKSIYAHKFHNGAIDFEGGFWVWGYNASGELGTGDTKTLLVPKKIMDGVSNAILGGWYTLIIKNDKSVWACGMNNDGQFGNGTNKGSLCPINVTEHFGKYKNIVAGGFHTVVLRDDGTVSSCGKNEFGELGDTTAVSRNTLKSIDGLEDIQSIWASWFGVYALRKDGLLSCFGRNNFGQLFDGNTNRYYPVAVINTVSK